MDSPELSDIGEGMAGRSVRVFFCYERAESRTRLEGFICFVRLGLATALVWAFSGLCFATDLYPLFLCLADNVHGRQGVALHGAGRGGGSEVPAPRVLDIWHYYGYTIDMLDASQDVFSQMLSARRCLWIDGQSRRRTMVKAKLRARKSNHVRLLDSGLFC